MGARLHSQWQYIRKHRRVAIMIALVRAAMALIFVECLMNGTGFNGYYTTATTRTISGSPPTITSTAIDQPGKTLWDCLQLLLIPAVLARAGYSSNLTRSRIILRFYTLVLYIRGCPGCALLQWVPCDVCRGAVRLLV